ncbi:bifunctional diguanylate cyclase/phosphodiesterase [Glaciecola sp. MH2013]|uniref:putative bifunctional diguanylate cyclase/phosphodiesterase n=1 Tax=Glaciecola sp. MH2013 TaxID=2785524 RepID=UPI00189E4D53|nr:bifunctional diguanylate cyclase/phosphodiesterase [Glaciecola sp. MH2013]MBF7072987.1 bifunctional diguanylate cyclase/phosphodiesterase [Glaciecola sp. MH2013]
MIKKHQSLSTLPNRYAFIDIIEKLSKDSRHFSLMLIDVMRFSDVSSAFDYRAGDEILLQIANRVLSIFDEKLLVGRVSGDIFGLIFVGRYNEAQMYSRYQHLIEHFKTPLYTNDTAFIADFNVGVASHRDYTVSVTRLVSLAEAALKQAKNNQHQNFSFVSDNQNSVSGRGLALKADLTRAMENHELELYFQPKVDFTSLKIVGAECLLRWNHPLDGMLFPGTLIEAAESYNMMNVLGEWTMARAISMLQKLNQQGINLPISINLSPSQLYDTNLVNILSELITSHDVQASMIELELTEDVALSNSLMVKRQLDDIRSKGVQISMDDFGKGYSNLSFIRDLNLNAIKIDKTFVLDLEESPVNIAIVQATKLICDAKNCKVIAEGVENLNQMAILQKIGIPCGQGFLFSPAVSFDEFIKQCRVGDFSHRIIDAGDSADQAS